MEKENEWIEKKVECGNCDNGKVRAYVEWIPGRRCRISVICKVCDGKGEHSIWIPKFCQMPDCVNETINKCSGHYCHGNVAPVVLLMSQCAPGSNVDVTIATGRWRR